MTNKKKSLIALFLLVFGVFGGELNVLKYIPFPTPEPPAAKILNIETPSEDVIEKVGKFSDIISDPDDRAKIAIFNYEFAQRCLEYKVTSQNINDIYSLAGKTFFKEDLVDKYDNLAEEIVTLLKECVGEDNHIITQEEKNNLHKYFMGVAWVLIHKG
jgi:AAA+ ATPase superfamily predicted ATPase